MLCFASAFLVAFARVYADQHWFSDVSAGAMLGILSGLWLARLHARLPDSAFDRLLLGASPRSV
jgi:membrane-associated phospholipid phosphatase